MRVGDVVFVAPDKLGGSLEIVRALVRARPAGAPATHLVLTDNVLDTDARSRPDDVVPLAVVRCALPAENLYAALARLASALPVGPGVLVAGDWLELAMEHAYPTGRAVVLVLHGDHEYYYDLAARHASVIDRFVVYSHAMGTGLVARLPHRAADIRYLPYGVPLPASARQPFDGPLRLVYAGRLEHGQKGVLDLPHIDRALADAGVSVRWTIIGDGPHASALGAQWTPGRPVTWRGPLAHADVLRELSNHDVLVLPTRAEGLPVALVEAMGAGLVPVVSDIASGVPELVTDGVTGYRRPAGDVRAFAGVVAALARDRDTLERVSRAAREAVAGRFDPAARARAYFDLFTEAAASHRPRRATRAPYGSRLDQPWLPNALVRAIRSWRGRS